MKRIGIVSVDGTYRDAKNFGRLQQWGYEPFTVNTPELLSRAEAVIIPGGDSGVILNGLVKTGLAEALKDAAPSLPVWGLCAGMVVMAAEVLTADGFSDSGYMPLEAPPLGLLPISVERLAWGVNDFIVEVALREWPGDTLIAGGKCWFADAPGVAATWKKDVEILANYSHYGVERYIAVRYGKALATSFYWMDERMEEKILAWWLNS